MPPIDSSYGGHWWSLHLDLDFRSNNTHVVARDVVIRRRTQDLSRSDIESCPMPRASHFVALNVSFGQRSFLMGAGISESKEVALDVEQGDFLAFNVDQSSLAGRDLTRARRFHKFAHALSPLVGQEGALKQWRPDVLRRGR